MGKNGTSKKRKGKCPLCGDKLSNAITSYRKYGQHLKWIGDL
jgi:hypothetical protein